MTETLIEDLREEREVWLGHLSVGELDEARTSMDRIDGLLDDYLEGGDTIEFEPIEIST